MNKPLVSRYCGIYGCKYAPADESKLCDSHAIMNKLGKAGMAVAVTIALFLAGVALGSLTGCAAAPKAEEAGISKARLRELLSQCREANRERVRIIKEYEAADCKTNPAQDFGTINFGEAGN